MRLEVRGRGGFKGLERGLAMGSLMSRQSGELLRSEPFGMRDFFRPSAGSGARRTERSEDRDRRAILDEDQFICIQGDSPEGLQGFRDEIWACEKFLANADGGVKVVYMNSLVGIYF